MSSRNVMQDISEFFAREGRTWTTLRCLRKRLRRAGVPYGFCGYVVMSLHGLPRYTDEIGVLTTPEAYERFRALFANDYRQAKWPTNIRDAATDVLIKFFFADVMPPLATRHGYRIVSFAKMIELLFVAWRNTGLEISSELGAIATLIERVKPPREIGDAIDPAFREKYFHMWDVAQNAYDIFAN